MIALGRRFLGGLWMTLRWRRSSVTTVSRELADDLGVPEDAISRILDQTAADLRQLAAGDDASDARPIINKAMDEVARYGYHSRPCEEAMMERCLEELPERDHTILRYFKQGKKHREIAEIMGTDLESVRRSLIQTYSDLRMKMGAMCPDPGGGLPQPEQSRADGSLITPPIARNVSSS